MERPPLFAIERREICLRQLRLVFTVRRYGSAVHAMALCPSVRPSVTSRFYIKMADHIITQPVLADGRPYAAASSVEYQQLTLIPS